MFHLETAGLSDIGRRRANQEDAFLVDDEHRLYVVADGMGGHLAGEVASRMVVDTLRSSASGQKTPAYDAGADTGHAPGAAMLADWIREANRTVYRRSLRDEQCRGMGSTVAALLFAGDRAAAANVGDSPLYLLRAGGVEMLSAMHTVEAERSSADCRGTAPLSVLFHHMLTRAVGIEPDVRPHVSEMTCRAGDIFIICSDGLSNALRPDELPVAVCRADARGACRRLVDRALERGGDDNITVIVIKVLEG